MFDLNHYLNHLTVEEEDTDVRDCKIVIETVQLLTDDAWLSRSAFWGLTSAMENQLLFNATRRLPPLEQQINRLDPESGVLGETPLDVNWHSNEDKVHVSDELGTSERIEDVKTQINNIQIVMRTAGIMFVMFKRAHDSISDDLEQLTFDQIKASAARKRQGQPPSQQQIA